MLLEGAWLVPAVREAVLRLLGTRCAIYVVANAMETLFDELQVDLRGVGTGIFRTYKAFLPQPTWEGDLFRPL